MHELSIALSILEMAAEESRKQGASRVRRIHLKLGPLSGVVKEALLFAHEAAREGNLLGEAELDIEDVPVRAYCPQCQAERAVMSVQRLCCVTCETPTPDIVSGRDLEVVALEIE